MRKTRANPLLGGAFWTTVSFAVSSLVYILRISILTRFLEKSDFGVIAIVLFFIGFLTIFADLGVSTALLSKKDIKQKEYSSLYLISIILSIIMYVILLAATPLVAIFYEMPVLTTIIPILGVDLIISTLGRQFSIFKQKRMAFKNLAVIKIIAEISSLGIAIYTAIAGFGVYSLVLSTLFASIVSTALLILTEANRHKIIMYLNIKETKHLYSIGLYQTGAQILDFISSQIDVLILGKILPIEELGVYSIIKGFVFKIYSSINRIITKVTIPLLANIKADVALLKEIYLNVLSLSSLGNSMVFLTIATVPSAILLVFYGSDYVEYAPILLCLAVWAYFSSIVGYSSSIVVSSGETRRGFIWTQLRLVLNVLAIIIGAYFGELMGVSAMQAIYAVISVWLYWKVIVNKIVNSIKFLDYINGFWKPTVLACLFFPLFIYLNNLIHLDGILVVIINMTAVCVVFLLIFSRQIFRNIASTNRT